MKQRRGLGSGLDALIPSATPSSGVREIATTAIDQNSRQPRTHFDEAALDELAASIREHGIIQPLIVSERGAGRYELIAGERRWRAAQRAGLERVPAIVRETTPQELLELALIENVQRADLNPLEEAQAYQSLKEEFGLSDDQIAKRLGKNSRVAIANTRRLLKLPEQAQKALLNSQLSAGHGRALLMLETPEQQHAALGAILAEDLTVREAERLGELVVKQFNGDVARALGELRHGRVPRGTPQRVTSRSQKGAATRIETLSAEDQEIRREIERVLQTPVNIARSEKELKVTIAFHTEEKLQEFFDALNAAYSH
jgi:ParB family transcriptional regulator, chromosome partitioning protein